MHRAEDTPEAEIRRITLSLVAPLLRTKKLRAVDVFSDGKLRLWTEAVDKQLEMIGSAWKSIGDPTIGDIVMFIGPRNGLRDE